jgi:hypothetical protein
MRFAAGAAMEAVGGGALPAGARRSRSARASRPGTPWDAVAAGAPVAPQQQPPLPPPPLPPLPLPAAPVLPPVVPEYADLFRELAFSPADMWHGHIDYPLFEYCTSALDTAKLDELTYFEEIRPHVKLQLDALAAKTAQAKALFDTSKFAQLFGLPVFAALNFMIPSQRIKVLSFAMNFVEFEYSVSAAQPALVTAERLAAVRRLNCAYAEHLERAAAQVEEEDSSDSDRDEAQLISLDGKPLSRRRAVQGGLQPPPKRPRPAPLPLHRQL